jgi:hypothetical protein
MIVPVTAPRIPRSRLSQLIRFALVLVQVVIAFTPLVEARGVGAAAHVESRSDARHYVHAEANCAFCAVRTIHATPAVTQPEVLRGQILSSTPIALALFDPSAGAIDANFSRAPPRG